MQPSLVRQVAVIGNYLPRQCGIATFTTHLCEALAGEYPDLNVFAVPVNDQETGYPYPERVRFELIEQDRASYHRAAEFLNINNADLICLQHEFGIYGGEAGSYILDLLQEARMPIVTTLHTVLRDPKPDQRSVMNALADLSDCLVVMTERGRDFLQDVYGVPARKIQVIPHGVPDMAFIDPNFYKDQFDAEGCTVLLTFGLLSANKGIEYVINALPKIREKHPNVLYMVLGTTHPNVKRTEGEAYRNSLKALAEKLGVADCVRFYDEFVTQETLLEFIAAADIYLTPYLNEAQIVSGALAYNVGAGKAVISTPYWYAEELLAEGRGMLVPFRDSDAIAERVNELLENDVERHAMRKRAYLYGRLMIWPQVARQYMEVFQQVRAERFIIPRATPEAMRLPEVFPAVPFAHLRHLTDDTGIIQHAVYALPNYNEGYSIDDNARALIAAIQAERLRLPGCEDSHALASRYLAFLWHAFNPETGYFRNFMSYDRCWMEERGSDDSHARALWALGTVLRYSRDPSFQGVASILFDRALPVAATFEYPRSWAFTLLGIHQYLQTFGGDRNAQRQREHLAEHLLALYEENHTPDWRWFEPELTYDNATLARALLLSGRGMRRDDMVTTALTALEWLVRVQEPEGTHFVPIGSNGFYVRGGERARFDQQPIEAFATIAACLDAYRVSGDNRWRASAQRALSWFYGQNDLKSPLFNALTGGCFDGLQPDRTNQNQGAESSLAYLLSLLEFRLTPEDDPDMIRPKRRAPAQTA